MKYLVLIIIVAGCSTFAPKPVLSPAAKNMPEWIYSPYDHCVEAEEICATGEAKSMSAADLEAKKNLASVFEVRIRSDFSVSTSASQTMPWLSKVSEEVRGELKESVDEIIELVQIREHYKKDGLSYALASLKKNEALNLLKPRLKKIDTEIHRLWEKKQRTNLRKMVRLTLEREKLAERFAILSGVSSPPQVSFDEIMRWRDSKTKTQALYLNVGQAPSWLVDKLKELLTESGFRLVKTPGKLVLTVNVDSIKEYLNVKGFEKFTFTLKLQSIEEGERKKVLSTSESVTGRSQADALLKVKKQFSEYIEEHLSDLDLD
jgi:hypothetical protein